MRTSKRVMKATVVSVLMLGATVLATTDSRGQGAKPLSPEQASAKAVFDEDVADGLKGMKDDCGIDLAVTTDFENYVRSTSGGSGGKGADRGGKGGEGGNSGGPKKKEGDPAEWQRDQRDRTGPLSTHRNTCGAAIRALSRVCAKKRSPTAKPQLPAVKGLACLFGGVQPAQANDRMDDQVQRNMSFSNGVFTVHIPPFMMGNIDDNVFRSLTPLGDKTDRVNGSECALARDCRSGVCSKNVCTACGPQAACSGRTETCGKSGNCFHELTPEEVAKEREEQEARASEPQESKSGSKKPAAKKGLGQKCQSNSECESKICGTLSSGSLHKCTNHH